MPNASLAAIIVNWNAGALLHDTLTALVASGDSDIIDRVIIVDNASFDGSVDRLEESFSLPLEVLRNSENLGFAAACNQGAALARNATHLLFLNPDVRVYPGTLRGALDTLARREREGVGALGIALEDENGVIQRCCAHFPTIGGMLAQSMGLDRLAPRLFRPHFMTEWDHADTRAVDQVMGAFLLIPRGLFETLGGFDDRFFVYFEDVDLCHRIYDAGRIVVHDGSIRAYHRGQGTTRSIMGRRLFYNLRSRVLYADKHFGRVPALLVMTVGGLLEPFVRIAFLVARGQPRHVRDVLHGVLLFWHAIPTMFFGLKKLT